MQPKKANYFATPYGEHIGVQPYTAWQQVFDPLLTMGARNYSQLNNGAIDVILEYAANLPSPQCEIFIAMIGGQTTRVAPEADEKCIAWARNFFAKSKPYANGWAHVNFLTEDETDRIAFVYGAEYKRLGDLKKKYDPTNLFRMNQNIKPE